MRRRLAGSSGRPRPSPQLSLWMPIAYHGRASSLGSPSRPFARPREASSGADSAAVVGPTRRLDSSARLASSWVRAILPARRSRSRQPRGMWPACACSTTGRRAIFQSEYQPPRPLPRQEPGDDDFSLDRHARGPRAVSHRAPPRLDAPPLFNLSRGRNACRHGRNRHRARGAARDRRHARAGPPAARRARISGYSYWSIAQMIAQHTVNGCALRAGDQQSARHALPQIRVRA